ncbi:MAG: PA14 domain-containing protein [Sedimentisphaerales bacterium]
MCRKLIHLVSFILALGLCGSIASGQENQIINGEFDNGLLSWGSYGAAGFTFKVVPGAGLSGNSAVLIDITNASAATSIGISQGGFQLVEGETYPLGFIAKSDQEREMVVLIQLHKPEGEQWIDIVLERVALTTEPQKFFIEYTHEDESTEDHPDWSVNMYLMLKGAWWGMVGDDLNTKVWIDWVYFGAEPEVQERGRAVNPTPADGAILEDTWVNLTWFPGDFAVSHDMYLGENFDDVNDGLGDTFQSNQGLTSFIVGFPGFPYPDGLVPGTTYYWRIDEVNDTDPNSPWKGPVWSFTVPPRIAYDPNPPDGAKFVDPNVILRWAPGFGSKLHTIYFGNNFDDVNNAVVGLPQAETTYRPGTLELEKTYYWRVDEFSGAATEKGDVWSFTVTKAGGGLKAEYFNNTTLSGEPVLTRLDPEINFNWGNADEPGRNSPDASINVDNFSARWSGELEVDLTDTYTFQITANNGFRLWLDGKPIIDFWNNGTTSNRLSEPIELIGGDTHSIRMEYFEGEDTAIAQLFWESSTREQQIIPSGALQPPLKAGSPSPFNRSVDVKQTQILSWSPVEEAASHQVYFGTDEEALKNADTGSPEYKGIRNLGSESYDAGQLEWNATYYWRVDEVKADGTVQKGNIWSFTTANFLIVDDFEDYDIGNNEIWWAWKDGLGYAAHPTKPPYAGNGTGSMVGDETTGSYCEETIVHGGSQSMPLFYDNNMQGKSKYSEAELTLTYPRDWTENGVNTLSIWFRGIADNAAEMLYVALNGSAVVSHDNPNAAQIDTWTVWNIDLQAFADQGVNLANVNTLALGLGNKKNPVAGGSGTMYFDDIRLYPPAP